MNAHHERMDYDLAAAALVFDEPLTHDASQEVDTVAIETDRPAVNVLYMSELLVGHKDAAIDFYKDTVEQVHDLPETMRPDVIVLSGMLQGNFQSLEKHKRPTLDPALTSMDAQFRTAKELIDLARDTGMPVIYNLSDDDRRIARDAAIEAFRLTQRLAREGQKAARAAAKAEGSEPTYYEIDQIERNRAFDVHLQFQVDTVFPYCLRSGRRLRSAEEMSEHSGGEVAEEEYLMLLDTCRRLANGQQPNPRYAKYLEMDNLGNSDDGLIITDEVDLHITTAGRTYTDWVRHNLNYSAQPMPKNHMTRPVDTIKQLAAQGEDTPDMLVTQNNMEAVGVGVNQIGSEAWVVSTGGLLRAANMLRARGLVANAPGDKSRRSVVLNGRIRTPSATSHERTDDGRHIITFFNEKLNEKSHSISERMSIAELCDLQTGSITARPDLLAKYLDFIRTRVLGERALALFLGGDMIHGRNYPDFPRESQLTGLMSMDSQVGFNKALFRGAFKDITSEELKGLEKVLVQIGNHEWNSGTLKWHGYSFADYMKEIFERMYVRAGYSDEEIAERVKFQDAVVTQKGEYAKSYTGVEHFGDMGILIQHYLLERGGKGSGGGLPVHQAHDYATGAGDLVKNIDVLMAGHWHHPQYALHGDKLGLVGGSMAGLSGYELNRGYRPGIAGTVLHLGGGLPLQVEFVGEEALHNHQITTGEFSVQSLKAAKFRDDRNFDPLRHGFMLPDTFPKSALQKAIWLKMREASQSTHNLAVLR